MPITTPDSRYIVIRGRLWRASNPELSQFSRERHTRALMNARRAVHAARKTGDKEAEARARQRVNAAKEALGERGRLWWADEAPDLNRHKIENTAYRDWWREIGIVRSTILELLDTRRADGTICPSEVARAIRSEGWRKIMPDVRKVARELAREGLVDITQKGKPLSLETEWRGPIRIRYPPR